MAVQKLSDPTNKTNRYYDKVYELLTFKRIEDERQMKFDKLDKTMVKLLELNTNLRNFKPPQHFCKYWLLDVEDMVNDYLTKN